MATKSKSTPAKKTAAKKPAAKKPAAKKPAVKKAVAKKPAAKKPAAAKATKTTSKAKAPAKKAITAVKKTTATTAKTPVKKASIATKATTVKILPAKKTSKKSSTVAKSSDANRTAEVLPMSNALDVRELDFAPYAMTDEEEYMNPPQLEHFRRILLGWKQVLMEQVDATVSHMQNEPGNLADPNDCATREEEFNLELRTRDRERQLIKKIESTLQQIKQSEYGYCSQCGEEIGVRRLEARPTASLCIDCKTLAEIREKHYSN